MSRNLAKQALIDQLKSSEHERMEVISDAVNENVELSKNANTEAAYEAAVKEFMVDYSGNLPCSPEDLAGYLSVFSAIHKPATLDLRRSMISKWHKMNGYPDPADSVLVRDVVKGIRKKITTPQKQAKALDVDKLESVVEYFDDMFCIASGIEHEKKRRAAELKAKRDKAFLLLGYWFGLRCDSLLMIEAEHLVIEKTRKGQQLTLFQPRSKTDSNSEGRTRVMKATGFLCPVQAIDQWLQISEIHFGPVFRGVTMWGVIQDKAIHRSSVNRLMKDFFTKAGLLGELYSTHSMRRGLANFLVAEKQTDKEIMDWIGWTDYRTALRYQDGKESLANKALEGYIQREFGQLPDDQFRVLID